MSETRFLPALHAWFGLDERIHAAAVQAMESIQKAGGLEACLPEGKHIFRAFESVSPDRCSVILVAQDPYPDPRHAMGLAFSSNAPRVPASLRNIFLELKDDLDVPPPASADISYLCAQGVLLANAALTIGRDGSSHARHWREFTQAWVAALAAARPVVWLLWGQHAQAWKPLIRQAGAAHPHRILESAHPSPLSARRGFFGSRPFSACNAALQSLGLPDIDWRAPETAPTQGILL